MQALAKAAPFNLADASILDIGCGFAFPDEKGVLQNSYQPWLCRALHSMGAGIAGIDVSCLVLRERFDAYCIDLMVEGSLSLFPDNSVDIAFANMLFDDPGLLQSYGPHAGEALRSRLVPQLERIVRPSGVFIYTEF
jgi:SAM-dependent methyltransferase